MQTFGILSLHNMEQLLQKTLSNEHKPITNHVN